MIYRAQTEKYPVRTLLGSKKTGWARAHLDRDGHLAVAPSPPTPLPPAARGERQRVGRDTMIYRVQTGKYPVRTHSGMYGTGWSGEGQRLGTGLGIGTGLVVSPRKARRNRPINQMTAGTGPGVEMERDWPVGRWVGTLCFTR
jgi:hypothetical protein